MPTYKILRGKFARPARHEDNSDVATIILRPGDTIEMTEEEAKSHIAVGKLEDPTPKVERPRKVFHGKPHEPVAAPTAAPADPVDVADAQQGGLQIPANAAVAAAGGAKPVIPKATKAKD